MIPRIGNIVPEYEEREAAVFTHTNWSQWLKLSWYDRAASIAQYRTHHLIEAVVNDEASYQANKRQPKPGPRRR